jgi:hypothetical protein
VPELKLARLPDRTPAKITITVSSDLNRALNEYAEIYRATYGEAEPVAELIPYMLGVFLDSDRGFAKARRGENLALRREIAVNARSGERQTSTLPPPEPSVRT